MAQERDDGPDRTFERYYEVYKHAAQRWTLWLSLGNAGGLAAVASKITDKLDPVITAALLPSAWCFTVGLLAAGGLALTKRLRLDWEQSNLDRLHADEPRAQAILGRTLKFEGWLEVIAVLALTGGLLIPLLQISSGYELALPY